MIKSETGLVEIKGDMDDVIFECNHLIRVLAEGHPELLSAVLYKHGDLLQEAVHKSDLCILRTIEDYIDHIEKIRKAVNDED